MDGTINILYFCGTMKMRIVLLSCGLQQTRCLLYLMTDWWTANTDKIIVTDMNESPRRKLSYSHIMHYKSQMDYPCFSLVYKYTSLLTM
jgi:hypothetical protein